VAARWKHESKPVGFRSADGWSALLTDALPRVFGFVLLRVGMDRALAEDLTQETMAALVNTVRSGEEIIDPLAWLFVAARHRVIDHYRRYERPDRIEQALDDDLADAIDADFERVLDQDELEACLVRIPAMQRIALLMHYAEGFRITEIATYLGRTDRAVESLLTRGRTSMRRLLSEKEV